MSFNTIDAVGALALALYIHKRPLTNALIASTSWIIDKFVDLKWAILVPSVPSEHLLAPFSDRSDFTIPCTCTTDSHPWLWGLEVSEPERCPALGCSVPNHLMYKYRDRYYITPVSPEYLRSTFIPPTPFLSEIDQVYDEDECVTSIVLYQGHAVIARLTPDTPKGPSCVPGDIVQTICSFAGPLCDFHNIVPSIETLRQYCPAFEPIDKVVVTTSNYQEYVLTKNTIPANSDQPA